MSMPPAVIVTKTEPCCECGECDDQPTPPPVVTKTAPCCECGECEEQTTPAALTSTISVCKASAHSGIIPYTSGSSTFYISSCATSTLWYTPSPSTVWYTQNATAGTCAPQTSTIWSTLTTPGSGSCLSPSTVFASVTLPGATSVSTSISTVIQYQNGAAPPAQTVTIAGSGSIVPTTIYVTGTSLQGYTTDMFLTSEVFTTLPGVTIISTTTQLTIVFSTIVQTATETDLSISSAPTTILTTEDITFTSQLPAETSGQYPASVHADYHIAGLYGRCNINSGCLNQSFDFYNLRNRGHNNEDAASQYSIRDNELSSRYPDDHINASFNDYTNRLWNSQHAKNDAGCIYSDRYGGWRHQNGYSNADIRIRCHHYPDHIWHQNGYSNTDIWISRHHYSDFSWHCHNENNDARCIYHNQHSERSSYYYNEHESCKRRRDDSDCHERHTRNQYGDEHSLSRDLYLDQDSNCYCYGIDRFDRFNYNDAHCTPLASTATKTATATLMATSDIYSFSTGTATACATPTGQFNIEIRPPLNSPQGYTIYCLTSTNGGAVPAGDHETLTITSNSVNFTTFSSVSNGQTTIIAAGGLTPFSDQDSSGAGKEPIYFDSGTTIQSYGAGGYDAVQFCLQSDNSFLVQNPTDGAAVVQICSDNFIYLYTAANAATSGCTTVTL
ncbi:hypothetical protein LTR85_001107 [Meristemomyces frigidus]|nr:hypothetical protein LTR85_001107 [Meristemomyces frigidus]